MRKLFFLALMLTIITYSCGQKPASSATSDNDSLSQDTTMTTTSTKPDEVKLLGEGNRPLGSVTKMLFNEFDSADVYNDNILYGYWFKPHEASYVNIYFHKNNIFEMKYYTTSTTGDVENIYKTGTFMVKGDSVYLTSADGWKLSVRYWDPWKNGAGKYLTKNEHQADEIYLVKGSD